MFDKLFGNPKFRQRFDAGQSLVLPDPKTTGNGDTPAHTYLSLRQRQNSIFAKAAVRDGISLMETEPEKAMKKYNNAIELSATCVEAFVARGAAFANKKEYKKASKDFKTALKIDPEHPDALSYLEQTRARLSMEKKVKKDLKRGEFVMPDSNHDPSEPLSLDVGASSLQMTTLLDDQPPVGSGKGKKPKKKKSKSRKRKHSLMSDIEDGQLTS